MKNRQQSVQRTIPSRHDEIGILSLIDVKYNTYLRTENESESSGVIMNLVVSSVYTSGIGHIIPVTARRGTRRLSKKTIRYREVS